MGDSVTTWDISASRCYIYALLLLSSILIHYATAEMVVRLRCQNVHISRWSSAVKAQLVVVSTSCSESAFFLLMSKRRVAIAVARFVSGDFAVCLVPSRECLCLSIAA